MLGHEDEIDDYEYYTECESNLMSIRSEDELCDALSEEYKVATEPTNKMNYCTYRNGTRALS